MHDIQTHRMLINVSHVQLFLSDKTQLFWMYYKPIKVDSNNSVSVQG